MNYSEIDIKDLDFNPIRKIGYEWMLVACKSGDRVNAMTASWGGLGYIWEKKVTFMTLRPLRYTKELIDNSDKFALCFFDKEYKKDMAYFGTVSGRDEDKISNSNLTIDYMDGVPYFKEANLVIVCKKTFMSNFIDSDFIDRELIDNFYNGEGFHSFYISEIDKVYVRD